LVDLALALRKALAEAVVQVLNEERAGELPIAQIDEVVAVEIEPEHRSWLERRSILGKRRERQKRPMTADAGREGRQTAAAHHALHRLLLVDAEARGKRVADEHRLLAVPEIDPVLVVEAKSIGAKDRILALVAFVATGQDCVGRPAQRQEAGQVAGFYRRQEERDVGDPRRILLVVREDLAQVLFRPPVD
jgi:hypothetical protein